MESPLQNQMHKSIRKYLERHAEGTLEEIHKSSPQKLYGHVIVIPAYGEDDSLFSTLDSIPPGPRGETLKIVVVNGRADSPSSVHERNLRHLSELPRLKDLILLDRASPGNTLPPGQGVGLARKVGGDVALALILSGRVQSPWIHCTDADTTLPHDYFERLPTEDKSVSACVYPFHHLCEADRETAQAMRFYEISLRYYVLGLKYCASPYAYPSLGSCLAIHAEAYARIGGFPRRRAGEDFYLLNKAAKTGRILLLPGTPLLIRGRLSDRVPFGTGKALHRISEEIRSGLPFRLYHPRIFSYLGAWLEILTDWALSDRYGEASETGALRAMVRKSSRETLNSDLDGNLFEEILEEMEVFSGLERTIPPALKPKARLRHAHTWWDAFRTLKFIHTLRKARYASLPLPEALSQAEFLDAGPYLSQNDWEGLRLHLAQAEALTHSISRGLHA